MSVISNILKLVDQLLANRSQRFSHSLCAVGNVLLYIKDKYVNFCSFLCWVFLNEEYDGSVLLLNVPSSMHGSLG